MYHLQNCNPCCRFLTHVQYYFFFLSNIHDSHLHELPDPFLIGYGQELLPAVFPYIWITFLVIPNNFRKQVELAFQGFIAR